MFDIKINKVFVDPRTGQDMYVLSIQLGDVYYNLNVTKEQFEKITRWQRNTFKKSNTYT